MSWNFYNLHYTVSALLSDRQLIMGMSLLLKHITQNEHLSVPIKPWKGTIIAMWRQNHQNRHVLPFSLNRAEVLKLSQSTPPLSSPCQSAFTALLHSQQSEKERGTERQREGEGEGEGRLELKLKGRENVMK